MKNAIDILIDKIKETNNPTVMGLDPRYEMLPECIKAKYGTDVKSVCEGIIEYNKALIDATYDIIPAVKPQIAFYEMFGIEGMKAFKETCRYAKEKGMIVIADIKRGDIGTTAAGYSNAYLGQTLVGDKEESFYDIDWVTVNPYLGVDGVKPFVEDCKKYNKGIFVLVTVYEKVAELVNSWGEDLIGEYGYSSVASVVGATYPVQMENLRKIMPNSYFLIPGYGAQGGKAEDLAVGFKDGLGGIVNASRSLMCAFKSDRWKDEFKDEEYAQATRAEAIRMRDELNQAIK